MLASCSYGLISCSAEDYLLDLKVPRYSNLSPTDWRLASLISSYMRLFALHNFIYILYISIYIYINFCFVITCHISNPCCLSLVCLFFHSWDRHQLTNIQEPVLREMPLVGWVMGYWIVQSKHSCTYDNHYHHYYNHRHQTLSQNQTWSPNLPPLAKQEQ